MLRWFALPIVACTVMATAAPCAAQMPIWMLAQSLRRAAAAPPSSGSSPTAANPGEQCRVAIAFEERRRGLPAHLMAAIARVESGRRDAAGEINPWPWSINVEGADHVYGTKSEAIAAVRAFQAGGARSIDVGCMQVNLLHHPDAFASLEDGFDPARNAAYAADFLVRLRQQTGDWATATAWYHSATPELGGPYQRRVMAVLPEEAARPPGAAATAPIGAPSAGLALPRPALGPFMLSNNAASARVLPIADGAAGRSLAAYRAAPIPIASRVALR